MNILLHESVSDINTDFDELKKLTSQLDVLIRLDVNLDVAWKLSTSSIRKRNYIPLHLRLRLNGLILCEAKFSISTHFGVVEDKTINVIR